MRKIVSYNHVAEYNMGGPSIMHGLYEMLQEIYPEGFELVNIQHRQPLPTHAIADMPFLTYAISPYTVKDFFRAFFLKKRVNAGPGQISISDAIKYVQQADVVVDLFAITFCDKFGKETRPEILCNLYTLLEFPLSLAAKSAHIRSVKVPSSFGPMQSGFTKKSARFAANHLFDLLIAREHQSQQAMRDAGVNKIIPFSPDIANLMKFTERHPYNRPTVGLSISHQIIRQWKSAEDYVQCIARLCYHIQKSYGADTLLIPNEILPETAYNDIDVAEDISELLKSMGSSTWILNSQDLTSTEIKNYIAGCEVVVSSRYHSCVAALSARVPLLVIGWHYKYEELMHSYQQDQWMLSETDCDSKKLLATFDDLWAQRAQIREQLEEIYPEVHRQVIEVGKQMLSGEK